MILRLEKSDAPENNQSASFYPQIQLCFNPRSFGRMQFYSISQRLSGSGSSSSGLRFQAKLFSTTYRLGQFWQGELSKVCSRMFWAMVVETKFLGSENFMR